MYDMLCAIRYTNGDVTAYPAPIDSMPLYLDAL